MPGFVLQLYGQGNIPAFHKQEVRREEAGPLAYLSCAAEAPDGSVIIPHTGPPVSAFQKAIRGEASVLRDHICKEMNELNLERCRCIPKNVPGADWRVLQEIVAAHPERTNFKACPSIFL